MRARVPARVQPQLQHQCRESKVAAGELTFAEQDQHQSRKRVPQEGAVHDGVRIDFFSLSLSRSVCVSPSLALFNLRHRRKCLGIPPVRHRSGGDLKNKNNNKQQQPKAKGMKR